MKTKLLLSTQSSIRDFFSPGLIRFLLILALCPAPCALRQAFAQTPQGFNYQAIARDGSGNPIVGATIKVKLSILSDTAGFGAGTGGTYLWEEEHLSVSTNAYGLFTVVLGDPLATKVDGSAASFSVINWSVSNLYIGTKIANPTAYKVLGAAKLWSVPYALRAKDSDQWQVNGSNIYRPAGNIGLGTTTPTERVEIQGSNSKIYLNSTTSNLLLFNQQGLGPPSFSTRSVGTKITLFPGVSATTTDYAIGIDANTLWMGIPTSADAFKYYAGTSEILRIMGTGNVGIGTTSPLNKLDVAGRIRIQYNGGTAGLYLTNAANTTNRSFIGMVDDNNVGLWGQGITGGWGFNMNVNTGNVGIGTTNPLSKLSFGNYFINSTTPTSTEQTSAIRLFDIGDGSVTYGFGISTNSLNIAANQSTGNIRLYTNSVERVRVDPSGNVGIGTTLPTSKMVIQPPATWDDNVPLFEVKNKYGTPVLAVYNNGIRILVAHDAAKGVTKGGFAIGGFDNTKAVGETVNLMTVAPDSIRFNIDNDDTKGITKGGFAIGGFDVSKGINVNPKAFMNMTPLGSPNGQYNTFLGYGSGKNNTTGIKNAFIGYNAGLYNKTGVQNVIVGTGQLWTGLPMLTPTDLGSYNTFVGYYAGGYCRGIENTAVGNSSGVNLTDLTNYNSFFGRLSGNKLNSGEGNVFLGNEAGKNQTSGNYNTYVGGAAGWDNISGSNNLFIGIDAGHGITTGSNNIVIGCNSATTVPAIGGSNNLLIGPIVTGIPFICGNMSAYMLGVGRVPTAVTFEVGGNASKATAGAWLANSDFRIKKDIEDIDNALELIQQLHPVKFSYSDEWLRRNPVIKDRVYYNFIAQEYKQVFPESVQGSGEYLKGQTDEILQMDSYNSQIIAVKAIQELIRQNKEQQIQIESTMEENLLLKSQLQLLQEKMERIEAMLVKGGVK